ncbi:tyrosine-protein kinase receptor Tie-2-like [Acanthaster planci]|uniref:Tyrosine-protein kinase receptor Tie-2-like n=1 Tax=Acanthaster planci TaxID=133434 RepID=A0A8B7YV49_ACAPL|nr:tyrosine-protein kinase receptor Tie-2-like [Acanthaster planci]
MADRVIVVFLLLGLLTEITVASATLDFTCITKPRINIDDEDTYIAAYLHGSNGSLSFRQTLAPAGTDHNTETLPPNSSLLATAQSLQESAVFNKLELPVTGGKTRIGAFDCDVTMAGGGSSSITTIIMSSKADFVPRRASLTANLGDAVNLKVTAADLNSQKYRWRKDGSESIRSQKNQLSYDLYNVTNSSSGIYEVHLNGKRRDGSQALMQLIVRDCKQSKWNPPSCNMDCPTCLNGGVCDDTNGDCICPPGFSGDLCKIPEGPNRFGQTGSFRCDSPELGGGPTCAGTLFCLPDPYGCSCAAGYQGIDCNESKYRFQAVIEILVK